MCADALPLVVRPQSSHCQDVVRAELAGVAEAHIENPADAYEAYFDVAWRNLLRLGVPSTSIEDAVQDAFLVVHRRWQDFRHQSSVRTWVIGICLRVARDYRRKRLRAAQDQELENDAVTSLDCPQATVERLRATALLMALLDGLDESHRGILVLVELEELSVAEAAQAIGIPVSTAYKRLANAQKLLDRAVARQKAQDRWRLGWQR